MNPLLAKLQPYPFEKLRALIAGNTPPAALRPINLQIGEPKHPTPALVKNALAAALDGLASYPVTAGTPELRQAIAKWLARRYGIPQPDAEKEVLPVNGTREALFAFAQTLIDPSREARVVCPNPFYQIYEGAALLAGATPIYGAPETWAGGVKWSSGAGRGVIEMVEPPRRFVFRWRSGTDNVPMTRVEFTLEAHPDGTRLCLVESGFASLPPELRGRAHGDNTVGWQRELGELAQYLAMR